MRHSRNLRPLRLKVVGMHVFVCFAEEPPAAIAKLEETMTPRFAPYELQNTRIPTRMRKYALD